MNTCCTPNYVLNQIKVGQDQKWPLTCTNTTDHHTNIINPMSLLMSLLPQNSVAILYRDIDCDIQFSISSGWNYLCLTWSLSWDAVQKYRSDTLWVLQLAIYIGLCNILDFIYNSYCYISLGYCHKFFNTMILFYKYLLYICG